MNGDPRKILDLTKSESDALRARLKAHRHPTASGPVAVPKSGDRAGLVEPQVFEARGKKLGIDAVHLLHVEEGFFLDYLEPEEAGRLIKAIAKAANLHPEAIADFIDDLNQIFPT